MQVKLTRRFFDGQVMHMPGDVISHPKPPSTAIDMASGKRVRDVAKRTAAVSVSDEEQALRDRIAELEAALAAKAEGAKEPKEEPPAPPKEPETLSELQKAEQNKVMDPSEITGPTPPSALVKKPETKKEADKK